MTDSTPFLTENRNPWPQEWRKRYESLGMTTIPLIGKSPFDPISWKTTPAENQWSLAGTAFQGNIGIIMENGLAVIDADDHPTSDLVENGLRSLGYICPIVSSPHGKHFYLRVADVPDGFNASKLFQDTYVGELRIRNSYVVAPYSEVDGRPYTWEKGYPEDLRAQAVIQWKDLQCLLPVQPIVSVVSLPVRLLHRDIPGSASTLLEELKDARKGESVGRYNSRSEAEAAAISMLILAGWSHDEILDAFVQYSPGKFHELKGTGQQKYFDRTFGRVLSNIVSNPSRKKIAYEWMAVHADPYWPGASGYLQREAYLGLLAISYQFASLDVNASERDLAEYAAASQAGIHRALRSLIANKVVERQNIVQNPFESNKWKLNFLKSGSSQVMTYDYFLREDPPAVAELWSPAKLGRAAGPIYGLLGETPVKVSQLARRTGKAWGTVNSALRRLGQFGLAIHHEKKWIRGNRSLFDVADEWETRTAALRRHSYHQRQRESHMKRLAKYRKLEMYSDE